MARWLPAVAILTLASLVPVACVSHSEELPKHEAERGTYQVLITFWPDTPVERVEAVNLALERLGLVIEGKHLGRVVLATAPRALPLERIQAMAKTYREVKAVESNSTIRAQ